MKIILLLSLLAALESCSGTRRNPEVCCENELECTKLGTHEFVFCSTGACVNFTCTEDGTCDGDEDCAAPAICLSATCIAPTDAGVSTDTSGPLPGMVTIPGGSFLRGCNSVVDDCSSRPDEKPANLISVSTFAIDITEVTQAAYKLCMDSGPCTLPLTLFDPTGKPDFPVVSVTWDQADAYCTWKGKRLPTEAEWEKAAREIDGRKYPWGNSDPTCTLAHYLGCPLGDQQALVVGSKAGDSPQGLKDMGGNVSEWTSDWYGDAYYASSSTTDPQGPMTGNARVVRGGSWGFGTDFMRASERYSSAFSSERTGFRCAVKIP